MIQKELNKNEQLFRQLYEAIRGGEIPNGARLATELELAGQYGCSRITVRSSLRRLEELKLIRRVRGNGTYVNSENVRFSGRRNIAVVVSDVRAEDSDEVDPYFAQLMNSLLRYGNAYDYSASLIPMRPEDRSFMETFEREALDLSDYDGLIFAKQLTDEEIDALEGGRRNFVALQAPEGNREISYVSIDNFNGAYAATRHLLERGRRNIVFLHKSLQEKINCEKVDGYLQALDEYRLNSPLERRHYECTPYIEDEGAAIIRRLLEEGQKFDGLIVHGDWATYGAVSVLREHNLRIPEDVALIMYDDFYTIQRILKLRITAMRQPFGEQLRHAIRLLIRQWDQPKQTCTVQLIQPHLMIRETT